MFVTRTGLRAVLSYGIVSKCEKGIVNLYVFTFQRKKSQSKRVCAVACVSKQKGREERKECSLRSISWEGVGVKDANWWQRQVWWKVGCNSILMAVFLYNFHAVTIMRLK